MADPIQFIKAIITCDHCDFRKQINRTTLKDWLNVKCPDCDNILIDEKDLKIANSTEMAVDFINTLIGDVPDKDAKYEQIIIDSHVMKELLKL